MQEQQASRIFLIAAIVIGLLATGMAFIYLKNSASEEKGPKYKILTAKHDLRPTAAIDPDKDFNETEVPQSFTELRARALSPDVKSSYRGQHVNHLILATTPVMQTDLTAIGGIALADDKRAMAISVRGNNGILSDLYVGDLVKLYTTHLISQSPASSQAAAPTDNSAAPITLKPGELPFTVYAILPTPIRVLSIGGNASRTRRPVTASEQYDALAASSNLQTVTIEVTEEQACTILAQTGSGSSQVAVVLVLCPPNTSTGPAATKP